MAEELTRADEASDPLDDARRVIEHLERAVPARQRVGEAVGILMERYKLDRDAAFAYLVRTSSHTNTKLRDVAAEVVADTVARNTADRRSTMGGGASTDPDT